MSSKVIAGRYELLEKIGDGGMAIVYKAKCRLLNRLVAVKVLKPEFARDAKFVENFKRESHAAAALSHQNIVSVYDVGREGNINYIVMELVEGLTLNELIEDTAPMDHRKAVGIAKQIASGLAAAHKHGIIHRDVKPHNVLINEDGVAKIADFGIAKAVSGATMAGGTSEAVMGSVHYFSPEQARGTYVDERSDIYSLGVVLYEMLTGKVPFDGDNPVNVALMHINEDVPPPSSVVPTLPPALDKIVLKATARLQSERYRSAEEMIDDLDGVVMRTGMAGGAFVSSDQMRGNRSKARDDMETSSRERSEDAPKKRSKKKAAIIISIVAAALVALGLAYWFGLIGPKTIEVPDVKGMTYAEAKDELEAVNLRIKEGELVESNRYEDGEVVSQDPDDGEMARARQAVVVDICRGGQEGTVPKLVGLTESEAREMIERYGFELGEVTTDTGKREKGEVMRQNPKAGTEAEPGSKIDIVLSDGNGAEVPNLVGLSESEARAALERAGFTVGTVSRANSDSYAKGTVISQQYDSGTLLEKGRSVSFVVSEGSEDDSGTISLYIDYSSATEEVFYMTVTVSDASGTRNVVDGRRRNKSDGGETLNISGRGSGTITVVFDSTTVMRQSVNFATGELD